MSYEMNYNIGYGFILKRNITVTELATVLDSIVPTISQEIATFHIETITELIDYLEQNYLRVLMDNGIVISEIGDLTTAYRLVGVFSPKSHITLDSEMTGAVTKVPEPADKELSSVHDFASSLGVDDDEIGWFFYQKVF